jgi:hypothetical protein
VPIIDFGKEYEISKFEIIKRTNINPGMSGFDLTRLNFVLLDANKNVVKGFQTSQNAELYSENL